MEKNTQTKIIVHIHRPIGTLKESSQSFWSWNIFMWVFNFSFVYKNIFNINQVSNTYRDENGCQCQFIEIYQFFVEIWNIFVLQPTHQMQANTVKLATAELFIRYSINILSKRICKNFVCIFYEHKYADEM